MASKEVWCIRTHYDEYWDNCDVVKTRPCLNPPTKLVLYDHLKAEEARKGINIGLDSQRLPDQLWMLKCLSTLNPDHKVFVKGYVPTINDRPISINNRPLIDNPNNLYSGLKGYATAAGRAGGGGMSKAQRMEFAREAKLAAIAKQQKQLEALDAKIEQQSKKDAEKAEKQGKLMALEKQLAKERQENMQMHEVVRQYMELAELPDFQRLLRQHGMIEGDEEANLDESMESELSHDPNRIITPSATVPRPRGSISPLMQVSARVNQSTRGMRNEEMLSPNASRIQHQTNPDFTYLGPQ